MNPFCESDYPLGAAIPARDPHAVSVSLPMWRDVVGYEENDPAVVNAMRAGYPRFFISAFIHQLRTHYAAHIKAGEALWFFPTLRIAQECVTFVGEGRIQETVDSITLVIVPQDKDAAAKEFWQHAGLYVSSRQAEHILQGRKAAPAAIFDELKRLIASYWGGDVRDVFLAPTGMGAIFSAYQAFVAQGNTRTVQLGFPYLDTLKIQQKFGDGIFINYNTAQDLDVLARAIAEKPVAAVFCEIPGNPLLRTIDLKALKELLRPHAIPLVIDDTLGTPFDVDVMPYADVVVTSLTKFFCGIGNATGGSAILNPASPHYEMLRRNLFAREEVLYADDAQVLLDGGNRFRTRMQSINANADKLVAFLAAHPAVATVCYTKGDAAYDAIRKAGGGYGGVFSFVLKQKEKAQQVYDALQVNKGPSLGTDFTLCCPYTLLAHYGELDWAESCGVSRYLLRVSVGTENTADLIARFENALAVA